MSKIPYFCGVFLCAFLLSKSEAQTPVTVNVSSQIVQRDVVPLGVCLTDDSYWEAPVLKKRVQENFEGAIYRQAHTAYSQASGYFISWNPLNEAWRRLLIEKGKWRFLSGPNKGQTGRIRAITTVEVTFQDKIRYLPKIEFDRQDLIPLLGNDNTNLAVGNIGVGVALEAADLDQGYMNANRSWWNNANNKLVFGDVRPAGFGRAALALNGQYYFVAANRNLMKLNGTWKARFWAKNSASATTTPTLSVSLTNAPTSTVSMTSDWKKYEISFNVTGFANPDVAGISSTDEIVKFLPLGGEVLIDDIEVWKEEGDTNPTVFRDAYVNALKKLQPGSLRLLQMGGSSMENFVAPPLSQVRFTSRMLAQPGDFKDLVAYTANLPELLELCREVGADPWINLPGVITEDEMKQFMEFMNGPSTTGFGIKRAAQGQIAPWTSVFQRIHVEIGNEAWNNAAWFQTGGYNGPDYWSGLIATARNSPLNSPKLIFHAGGHSVNTFMNGHLLTNTPNADSLAVAPYWISGARWYPDTFISDPNSSNLSDTNTLFKWITASLYRTNNDTAKGYMSRNVALTQSKGKQLSVYETNFGGWGKSSNMTNDFRNRIMTSLGGGVNQLNGQLNLMKMGVRYQNFFQSIQNELDGVRGWGAILRIGTGTGTNIDRFQVTGEAIKLVNQFAKGDMVGTTQGNTPSFDVKGWFENVRADGSSDITQVNGVPSLTSYAFSNGRNKSLLLFNLDPSKAVDVQININAALQGATRKLVLTGPSVTSNNDNLSIAPSVVVSETSIANFTSGTSVNVPAASIVAFNWNETTAVNANSELTPNSSVWPQEGGVRRNYYTNQNDFRHDWNVTPPKVVWKAKVGLGTSPVVTDGTHVFTFGAVPAGSSLEGAVSAPAVRAPHHWEVLDGKVPATGVDEWAFSLDATTGQERWRQRLTQNSVSDANFYPRSSPLYSAGKVYFYTVSGLLVCLNSTDGSLVWKRDLGTLGFARYGLLVSSFCSPIAVSGNILVAVPCGARGPLKIVAFNPESGVTNWVYIHEERDNYGNLVGGYAPEIASLTWTMLGGRPNVIVSTGHGTLGVDAVTGKKLWLYQHSDGNPATSSNEIPSLDSDASSLRWWKDYGYPNVLPLAYGSTIVDRLFIGHGTNRSGTYGISLNGSGSTLLPTLNWWEGNMSSRWVPNALYGDRLLGYDMWTNTHTTQTVPNEIPRTHRPGELGQLQMRSVTDGTLNWSSNALLRVMEWDQNTPKDEYGYVYNYTPHYTVAGSSKMFIHDVKGLHVGQFSGTKFLPIGSLLFSDNGGQIGIKGSPPVLIKGRIYLRLYDEQNSLSQNGGNLICIDTSAPTTVTTTSSAAGS